jgi:hypothetical protein
MDIPKMLTIDAAAKRCNELEIGIAKHHIRQLCKTQAIPCIKIGKKTILNWNGLLEYLECRNMRQ